jgi:8-oxo-dGTP pyrophosphatase MutT (NUDIX family)
MMMTSPLKDHMLIDPGLQQEIARRAREGNFGEGQPRQAVNSLGSIDMPDGKRTPVYLRHAVDAVLLDALGNVVLITRRNNPGAGLEALPGGFLDPVRNAEGIIVVEQSSKAVLREAMEETGIAEHILATAKISPIGVRSYNRPFDIREAWSDISETPIRKGDLFAVSTQAFRIHVKGDLWRIPLRASDDASRVRVEKVAALRPEQFAVPDHLLIIRQAVASNS